MVMRPLINFYEFYLKWALEASQCRRETADTVEPLQVKVVVNTSIEGMVLVTIRAVEFA